MCVVDAFDSSGFHIRCRLQYAKVRTYLRSAPRMAGCGEREGRSKADLLKEAHDAKRGGNGRLVAEVGRMVLPTSRLADRVGATAPDLCGASLADGRRVTLFRPLRRRLRLYC